jgi:hypothetical protein
VTLPLPPLPAAGSTSWYTYAQALHDAVNAWGSGGGGGASTGDKIVYVSKAGNDTNNGLSWATAKLTINGALALLPGNTVGTIEAGAGTYQESLTLAGGKVIRGQGRFATIIELTANGNLVTVNNENNSRLEHLGLRFASSSVSGNLLYHTNAFTCDYEDVRFSGTNTAGQIGYRYDANAGDSHFFQCYFDALDVGVLSESTLVHFTHCIFSSCTTASVKGGDPTGATSAAGAAFESCTFRGSGARYVHINGEAQAWSFNNCWFDGAATTAVEVGNGTQGPWLFSLTNTPALVGAINSLIINAAGRVNLSGVAFTNTGTFPTELTVNATNAPRGSIHGCWSAQDTKLETKVPPKWQGWIGYVSSADDTVALVETAEDVRVPNFPQIKRRVVVHIANRSSGTAGVTLTLPSAFETTLGGGTVYKVLDNTPGSVVTFTNTTVTVPTGVAIGTAMVIIEGF